MMATDVLVGNELKAFVSEAFPRLFQLHAADVATIVSRAGCCVEDHARGLRSWMEIGGKIIEVPTRGRDRTKADYHRINDRSRSEIEAQLRMHVAALRTIALGGV